MYLDESKMWLFWINKDEIIPPFCCELVLKDGQKYYLHSIVNTDQEKRIFIMRIWDLRALSEHDIDKIKGKLNQMKHRDQLAEEQKIHPKIDWAILRVHLDNIMYTIEWHDRLWPKEERSKIGFVQE